MLGVKLADELSKQLGNSQKQIQVFDRNLRKSSTAIHHVDADSLKTDQEVTTFAHNLGASAVVSARAERIQGDSFRLSVRFLKAKDKSLVVRTDWIVDRTLPVETAPPAILTNSPTNPNSPSTVPTKMATPSCYYMPNPPYSKKAKKRPSFKV